MNLEELFLLEASRGSGSAIWTQDGRRVLSDQLIEQFIIVAADCCGSWTTCGPLVPLQWP